jgi:hypothetical protein
LAGFHANNFSMYDLAKNYRERGMAAYSELQEKEFEAEKWAMGKGRWLLPSLSLSLLHSLAPFRFGYTAVKHQREVISPSIY